MIKTITKYATNTLVIEKSRFICELFVIDNEQEAKQLIASVKEKHPKAVHHCYAYVIKKEFQNIENQSDDGEPSKTAGLPMLDILRYEKLVNVLAVVTRYFGGTLLGTGGLIRAYSNSVKEALKETEIKEAHLMSGYKISLDYSWHSIVEYEIKKAEGIIKDISFVEEVTITFYISDKTFIEYLQNKTNNSLEIFKLDSIYL
ncbi:YigZ family protein [Erysipelotrichaceae bacterium OttesenSCG-928-M19]|nr:YigZ family protein [Erysipelotrichaceae bacterium OttesenSCG-928-M19]